MSAQPGSPTAGPADPELDPTATFAVDPAVARRLAERIVSTSGESVTTHAPFTGQPVATLPLSSDADVDTAFASARQAQQRWAQTSIEQRVEALLRLHDLVFDRQDELMDLVQWESGKVRKHAFEEVAHVAMTARYYARTARRHLDSQRRLGVLPALTRVDVNRVPKGVVGIISPWNYPLTMAVSDGLPAMLAGNAVVHKPDSQTMLTGLAGIGLLEEAGFPRDLWQVVHGPGQVVGSAIIDRADYVCFTGSTATGRRVASRAAEAAVRACFSSAGQLCVSMERMYVADQVYDRFVERFLKRVGAIRLSASFDWAGDMGSLVSDAQLDTVRSHVDDAVAKGATVLAGGRPRPDVGPLFYEPTVLSGVSPSMTCFGNETFGPVVSLYRFHDEADAVERANAGSYGLNASVFTRDGKRGRAIARQIKAGSVNINEGYAASFGSVDTPMGGMRESGLGRRQGTEGIHRYTESQTVATQRVIPIAPVLGMGDRRYAQLMGASLRLLRRRTRRP
ncbi:MAG: aldehyde dehydrogenase family protein [Propionibacteriales bacterium]|nr:aldehyde dehydrogenase family protein [Propionibacteriales bacterium]